MIRYLMVSLLAIFMVGTASADETYKLNCTLDKYRPGQEYTEQFLRGWIPNNLVVDRKANQNVQIYFPSRSWRVTGEIYRENNKKFSLRFHQGSVANQNVTFSLDYFKESKKIYVSEEVRGGYAPMGDASGACKIFAVNQRTSKQRIPIDRFSRAQNKRVCIMAIKDGEWVPSSASRDWVAEARRRNLSLDDCNRVLQAN